MQKSFHQEWAFVQHLTQDIGMAFQAVEDELWYTFLPSLFQGSTSQIPGSAITGLPVKQAGIDLPDPTRTVGGELDGVLCGHGEPFRGAPQYSRIQVGQPRPPDWGGEVGYSVATCGGGRDFSGRGLGRRIQSRHPTSGEDSADGGVAFVAAVNRQWDRVRGAGMDRFPLPALRHQST